MKTDTYTVTATRTQGSLSATGTVSLGGAEPAAGQQPHLALAGARAWSALSAQALAAGDTAGAASAARAGLSELGMDYAGPTVEDDTQMKVFAAEDLIAQGRLADGAALLNRMLDERMALYVSSHASEIAAP